MFEKNVLESGAGSWLDKASHEAKTASYLAYQSYLAHDGGLSSELHQTVALDHMRELKLDEDQIKIATLTHLVLAHVQLFPGGDGELLRELLQGVMEDEYSSVYIYLGALVGLMTKGVDAWPAIEEYNERITVEEWEVAWGEVLAVSGIVWFTAHPEDMETVWHKWSNGAGNGQGGI